MIEQLKQQIRESNHDKEYWVQHIKEGMLKPELKAQLIEWLCEKPRFSNMAIHSEVKAGEM